jgi:putative tryptophan/tyrosine transport system substrate-binding protein
MKQTITTFTLSAMLLALCFPAGAQQPTKVPRIGYLVGASLSGVSARIEAFRQGLGELGYVEGKNIIIEYRYAEGKLDRLPPLVAELVRLKVDVIVANGPPSTRAAKEATVTIPIVMAQDSDPVGSGFVASLARPGGNITGLATLAPELSGKRLELLKEIIPKLARVAVLGTSTLPGNAQRLREVELAAGALKVQLQYLDVLSPKDIETAFRAAIKGRADAVLMMAAGGVVAAHRTQVVDLAVKSRLPAIYTNSLFVDAGGLMTYSANLTDGPPRRHIRGQDPQRCEARRSPCGAAEEVRAHHQFKSSKADRPDDSAECAGAGGSCYPMILEPKIGKPADKATQ